MANLGVGPVAWTLAEVGQLVLDFTENFSGDNPEYERGQLELMADMFPVPGMACGDRAEEIRDILMNPT